MKSVRPNLQNSAIALLFIGLASLLQCLFWLNAEWPAGGQDSWNHYLYARFAPAHPELFADQWGKPFFTLMAVPFARFGIEGIYVMNILCMAFGAWLLFLTARRLNFKMPWLASLFFLFQPVVFGNTISALTEPLNAFVLCLALYWLASLRYVPAAILVSLFPFFRSEGIILWAVVLLFFVIRSRWKPLIWLFSGTLALSLAGGVFSGDPFWILTHNPYFKAEIENRFQIGHGDFWHYLRAQRQIWGIAVTALSALALAWLLAHVVYLVQRKTPEEKSRFCFWLVAPMFIAFFLAHSWIWYKGSFGSHGLLRVFLLTAPLTALLAQYASDKLLSVDVKIIRRVFIAIAIILSVMGSYAGNKTPYPWESAPSVAAFPGEPQLDAALKFIATQGLNDKVLLHQMPWLNARLGLDPWAKPEDAETFYIWSIDKRPGQDWMPDSCVVLWDNFHARRDAPMTLSDMRKLKQYKELAYFQASDSIYDVRVFIKVR
ncbi:MAG: hypothetical protein ACK5FT_04235 [Sphingomonadales bacterium]|jgi:hypothetical protein